MSEVAPHKAFQIIDNKVILDPHWDDQRCMKELIIASNIVGGYQRDEQLIVNSLKSKVEALLEQEEPDINMLSELNLEIETHGAHVSQFAREYTIMMDRVDEIQAALLEEARQETRERSWTKPDLVEERAEQIKSGLITPEHKEKVETISRRDIKKTTGSKRTPDREGITISKPGGATGGRRRSYSSQAKESSKKGTFKIFPDKPMNKI